MMTDKLIAKTITFLTNKTKEKCQEMDRMFTRLGPVNSVMCCVFVVVVVWGGGGIDIHVFCKISDTNKPQKSKKKK